MGVKELVDKLKEIMEEHNELTYQQIAYYLDCSPTYAKDAAKILTSIDNRFKYEKGILKKIK